MNYKDLTEKDIILQFQIDLDEDLKMSLNKIWGGVHWGVRSTFRNIWHEEIYDIVQQAGISPIKDMIHIEYEYRFKSRYLDTSNCSVMNKAIEDGMVECGILEDDTPQYISSATTIVPVIANSDRRKLKGDTLIVTIYRLGIAPVKVGKVVREKGKNKKRTSKGINAKK